ncbi:MAG TPA: TPM domain-containing protein [Hanamia sp.]
MKIFFTYIFSLFLFATNVTAQNIPNYNPYRIMTPAELSVYRQSIWDTLPAAVGWVNDFEGLYDKIQEDSLESMIQHFEKKTSIEIAIVTVDSNMVSQDKFNEFTYRLLKIWGIGKIAKSNGMVICICKDYKSIYISSDFGLDTYLSDYDKYKIVNKSVLPYFKKNYYFNGTLSGLNAILEKINRKWSKNNKT